MAYSQERRSEVLAAYQEGLRTSEIALKFNCRQSWARRVKQEFREQGKTGPEKTRRRVPDWHAERERIRELTEQYPDQTLQELKDRLGTKLSRSTLCVALRKMKLTLKKVTKATEQDRPDVAQQCAQWTVWQAGLDPDRLVFIDETWAKTNMTRPRGRSPQGTRLIDKTPHGH